MTSHQPYEEALDTLRQWFDSHRPTPDTEPNTYVMCAGACCSGADAKGLPAREGQLRNAWESGENKRFSHSVDT